MELAGRVGAFWGEAPAGVWVEVTSKGEPALGAKTEAHQWVGGTPLIPDPPPARRE